MSKPVQKHRHASSNIPDLCGTVVNGTDIRLLNSIGKGSWGVVYLAERLDHPGVRYAVKVTDKRFFRADYDHREEGRLHKFASMASKHVVKFHKEIDDGVSGYHYLITDYCSGGDLRVRIEAEAGKPGLSNINPARCIRGNDELMKRLLIQALDAVASCHSQGIYHRDLKPDNLFLRDDANVFLGDFGFATMKTETSSFGTGSEPYMSPECFNEFREMRRFSCAQSDIWSFGMIMLTLVCGKFPWRRPSLDEYYYRVYVTADANVLLRMFDISPEFNTILKGAFSISPRKRVSLQSLRQQLIALKSFGSGAEIPRKPIPEIRVPVFIDLPSDVLGETPARPHVPSPLAGSAAAVDRAHPMFAPTPHYPQSRGSPMPPPPSPRTPEPELIFEREARERERKSRLRTIGKLLETTLPHSQNRPPLAPRPTRELLSSNDSDDEVPATPETLAVDAARAVTVVAANAGSPITTTFDPFIIPDPLPKRSKSEGLRTVDHARRKLRGMFDAFRAH